MNKPSAAQAAQKTVLPLLQSDSLPHRQPDASNHDPRPEYLRALLDQAGVSQRAAARRIGISERMMRYYIAGERKAPYPVQYAIEQLAGR